MIYNPPLPRTIVLKSLYLSLPVGIAIKMNGWAHPEVTEIIMRMTDDMDLIDRRSRYV
jgi:hypothetical protein